MPIRKELDELRKKGNVTLQDLINFFGREDIQLKLAESLFNWLKVTGYRRVGVAYVKLLKL